MYNIDAVIADGHFAGYQQATAHMLPVHALWELACAAWSNYWQRPEILSLEAGERGTAASMYLVAYAVGRTDQTARLAKAEVAL